MDDQEDLLGLKLKKAMMRGSFETPEARHSFCLSAFRPSMDLETDGMVSGEYLSKSYMMTRKKRR